MINHIHILGASGSGTTTLGNHIQKEFGFKQIDTDDFFWKTKYSEIRDRPERVELMNQEITKHNKWVVSGSLCDWGDIFIPLFDLVIFIYIQKEIRMERLKKREFERYGKLIEQGNEKHADYLEFMNWAEQYDTGDESVRSKILHLKWLEKLNCKVLKIEIILGPLCSEKDMIRVNDILHKSSKNYKLNRSKFTGQIRNPERD